MLGPTMHINREICHGHRHTGALEKFQVTGVKLRVNGAPDAAPPNVHLYRFVRTA